MKYKLKYSSRPGTIRISGLPASKSISNRALIIHALAKADSPLLNISRCDDTDVMQKALAERGPVVDILAAGTAMRFLTAYFSIQEGEEYIITGTQRMKQRPIGILVDALRTLGADIEYVEAEGFPPLRIRGKKLLKNRVELPGNVSSQYISALLLIGNQLPDGLELTLTGGSISRPYIHLTVEMMCSFGAAVEWCDEHHLRVHPVPYADRGYTIESDWSAASYWYEVAALARCAGTECSFVLPSLFPDSLQGDSRAIALYSQLGLTTRFTEEGVVISPEGELVERMDADLADIPDLAQTLVVMAAHLGIPFRFTGLQTLRIKETDRISALVTEMGKLGFVLHAEGDDALSWDGRRTESAAEVKIATYADHRMAMAFAPVALLREGIIIEHPGVVSKSYPGYWEDMKRAGLQIEEFA